MKGEPTLTQKVASEFIGTALLVATVIGSGIMAARLSPDDVGLQLLENSLATGAVLVALILTLQPVSAAFNPVVTLIEVIGRGITVRDAGPLLLAQFTGGVLGAVVANLMFDLDAVSISTHTRDGSGQYIGEVVATFGLIIVIFGGIRSGRTETIALSVGGYIAAAYWFTSSTSFANPAVTVARMFSDTFAGIKPSSVPAFVALQLLGGALAYLLLRVLYPNETPAVPPHEVAHSGEGTNP